MIIIEVNGIEKKIPQSYKEITVNQFTELWKILQKYDLTQEDDDIKRGVDEMDCTLEIVAKLLDIDLMDVDKIPYDKAIEVVNIFNNMISEERLDKDMSDWAFVHNNESYYFPKVTLDKLTFGEYADVKQIEAILGKDVENKFDFIPQQMAVMCRKHKEKKGSYDMNERIKEFSNLTMDVVMNFAFFLSKWNRILSQNIQTSTDNHKGLQKKLVTS